MPISQKVKPRPKKMIDDFPQGNSFNRRKSQDVDAGHLLSSELFSLLSSYGNLTVGGGGTCTPHSHPNRCPQPLLQLMPSKQSGLLAEVKQSVTMSSQMHIVTNHSHISFVLSTPVRWQWLVFMSILQRPGHSK